MTPGLSVRDMQGGCCFDINDSCRDMQGGCFFCINDRFFNNN